MLGQFGAARGGIVDHSGSGLISGDAAQYRYAVVGRLDAIAGSPKATHDEIARRSFGSDEAVDLASLRGSYSALVHDVKHATLTLISDHFGSLPMYVCRYRTAILFASQLKAILAVVPEPPQLDQDSVATMLSIGEVVGNRTLVAGIETIPAASRVTLSRAGVVIERYWTYCYEEDHALSWGDAVERAGETLKTSVARCIANSDSPAVPLSGGLDSRFVLDLACQRGARPRAYTWGVAGCRDLSYAAETAHRLGVEHDRFIFSPDYLSSVGELGVWITEGHIPATNFHVLPYVGELAAHHHDVLLDGFAGDGVMGGNFISDAWLRSRNVPESSEAIWKWRRSGFDGHWPHNAILPFQQIAGDLFRRAYLGYAGESPMDKAMAFLLDNRVRRITTCGSELFRSRVSVRQPFMDVDLIDAIRVIPHQWRKRHRFYLDVMRRYAPVSAKAPYQRTMLPATAPYWMTWCSLAGQRGAAEACSRLGLPDPFPGKSPSDFAGWMRGPLRGYIEGILLDRRTLDRGVIPANLIRDAVTLHTRGERNLSSLIGALLTIELFCREFLDELSSSIEKFGSHAMARAVSVK
ncbi:MAG: hypothetical protein J0M19_17045 [Sphingomonadales bacterium]|nr:hypothetical protein [Sphingomonadales bacterium]